MSVQSDFYSTLQAIYGAKLYPSIGPEGVTAPYGIYQRVVATPENNLRGFAGLTNTRMQLDTWAATQSAALTLAAAVRTALDASTLKQTCELEQDFYDADVKLHRVMQEFSIWH